MPVVKGQIDTIEDDFWTEHLPFLTAQFPTYYRKPQQVHGRFHTSEEKYEALRYEIIPISERKGKRTYVMMQPYVLEPKLTLTVGLYANPKRYADQESPIGETIGAPQVQGFRVAQVGNAQAWYYHTDKTIVRTLYAGRVCRCLSKRGHWTFLRHAGCGDNRQKGGSMARVRPQG
jgi:hypothetical protein